MAIQRRSFLTTVGAVGAAGVAGCLGGDDGDSTAEISGETLTLTTTTSTYATGLLDELNLAFEDRFGVEVDAVAQGTGAALRTAEDGDADVVMVHARSLEDEFMENGYGINRRDLMFNDFVVVGGSDDPASIAGSGGVTDAFSAIADAEAEFVSRGDDSGTHTKELEIWDETGLTVENFGDWYLDGGGGMGEILNRANEQGAYTLADRGTFLDMQSNIDLEIHVEGPIEDGPELLMNPYGIVAVNPAVHEDVEYDLAMAYIGFVTSIEGEEIIKNFTSEGEQLFFPEAVAEDPNFAQYVPEEWRGGGE